MSECAHMSQLCVSGQCVHLALQFVCLCVCVCYYIAAAIAVAATANIVATAASHAPPPPSSVLLSILSPQLIQKLEGEKSDPLQSKAQVLRQTMVLFPVRSILTFCYAETWASPSGN